MSSNTASSGVRKRIVVDEYGASYECLAMIGEGGQGKVWKTNHQNTLVKTFSIRDEKKRADWLAQIKRVLRQDLDALSIARPQAIVVKPLPGYVMELMDGLHSLQEEMESSFAALVEGDGLKGYLQTGGLKRRLHILRGLADTLSQLHARGLAYGDLSPNNIFVSKEVSQSRVWLIDADNISVNERQGDEHLYSPGYGAPEVVRGDSGINSLTDAWSFAVIAYSLLTLQHPFTTGIRVQDGEPEIEEAALLGELPWVNDSNDDSNSATGGIPIDLIARSGLRELFKRCFEDGKNNSWERPTLSEWRSVLNHAVSMIQNCTNPECMSTHYKSDTCPFCGESTDPNNFVQLAGLIFSTDKDLESPLLKTDRGLLANKHEVVSLRRVPAGSVTFDDSPEVCQVRLDDEGLGIRVTPGQRVLVVYSGRQKEITKGIKLSNGDKKGIRYDLHILNPDGLAESETHPVWAFRW